MCGGFLCRLFCCKRTVVEGEEPKTKSKTKSKSRNKKRKRSSPPPLDSGPPGSQLDSDVNPRCLAPVDSLLARENFWDPTFSDQSGVGPTGQVYDESSALLRTPDSWGSCSSLRPDSIFHASYGGDVSPKGQLSGVSAQDYGASRAEQAGGQQSRPATPGGSSTTRGDSRAGSNSGVGGGGGASPQVRSE